jgi:hypothetical protein
MPVLQNLQILEHLEFQSFMLGMVNLSSSPSLQNLCKTNFAEK